MFVVQFKKEAQGDNHASLHRYSRVSEHSHPGTGGVLLGGTPGKIEAEKARTNAASTSKNRWAAIDR